MIKNEGVRSLPTNGNGGGGGGEFCRFFMPKGFLRHKSSLITKLLIRIPGKETEEILRT